MGASRTHVRTALGELRIRRLHRLEHLRIRPLPSEDQLATGAESRVVPHSGVVTSAIEAPVPAARRGSDRVWIAVLAVSFALGLAVSWHRWGNPIIDTGREMNQPLRLAGGEMLYSDVRHIYGPLSPWLHAGLFRVFGPSLNLLYADGIITAMAILALVYWVARQIMGPAGAGAATLSVMWLCAFKPAGNYILPYSYSALHGAALGLVVLAMLVAVLKRTRAPAVTPFLCAGGVAALALLAKTEAGITAVAAGMTAAILAVYPNVRRGTWLAAAFVACAVGLPLVVYAIIAARVGWSTLSDSWLLMYNIPPELAYFNGWISGFDDPIKSLRRMFIAAVKLGVAAAIVASVSSVVVGDRLPWRALAVTALVVVVVWLTVGLDPDKGPYLAMPFLLVGLLVALVGRVGAHGAMAPSRRTCVLIVCTIYALASLARIILHVRSGGGYASYLLPVAVVVFTYLWVGPFARVLPPGRSRRVSRVIALALIVGNAAATAGVLAYRYQTRNTVAITTARGTMIAEADVGQAWNEALAYIDRHTRPGDAVAVLPEGTSLTFLSGRRNPLRDEIAIPGILDADAESHAIAQLQASRTRLILITNRPTAEFGPKAFGRDYYQRLMRWIEANYTTCEMFGPVKDPRLEIGDSPFFIRAYCAG
jgi:hypothetical protein